MATNDRTAPERHDAEERAWRLVLWSTEGIGPVRYARLIDAFGGAGAAIEAGPEACAGALRKPRLLERFRQAWGDEVRRALDAEIARYGIDAIERGGDAYPRLLDEADGPPWVFVQGSTESLGAPLAAVVGTRRIRTGGARLARRVARWAVERGWGVASGGARGVDAEAHREAIAMGTPTVVVLPAGLAHPTPPSHRRLFDTVCEGGGCLLSEHPPWRPPRPELFVRRNRLISGVSVITLVVRAPSRSGALVTADWARRQGRPVFAAPGSPSDPTAAGCLGLLRGGASMLTSASDLPRAAGETETEPVDDGFSATGPGAGLDDAAGRRGVEPGDAVVLEAMRAGPLTSEGLAAAVGWTAQAVLTATTRLLVAGRIEVAGPGLFRLAD